MSSTEFSVNGQSLPGAQGNLLTVYRRMPNEPIQWAQGPGFQPNMFPHAGAKSQLQVFV